MTKDVIEIRNLDVFYGGTKRVKNINLDIKKNKVTAFIGPSGCGKSTILRSINRMNDFIEGANCNGAIFFNGKNIYDKDVNLEILREKIGMVFQKPNPFPKSIFENVAYGPKIHNLCKNKVELDELVIKSLKRTGLWNEVKDILNQAGNSLSGGQQQRLCIARTIAVKPDVILMDEPCSALDPIATKVIEELIKELKQKYTIIIVTHSMAQAERISDYTAYFYLGELIEYGKTKDIFKNPKETATKAYIKGEVG